MRRTLLGLLSLVLLSTALVAAVPAAARVGAPATADVGAPAVAGVGAPAVAAAASDGRVRLPGLHAPASVVRDVDGLAHINAGNQHDLFFLQGWVHATDRLFQMDLTRRQASGTLAELLGRQRVARRRRGAHDRPASGRRAQPAACSPPRAGRRCEAYADGVNAWLARNTPPAQYADAAGHPRRAVDAGRQRS